MFGDNLSGKELRRYGRRYFELTEISERVKTDVCLCVVDTPSQHQTAGVEETLANKVANKAGIVYS
jgi:hypothetical protein